MSSYTAEALLAKLGRSLVAGSIAWLLPVCMGVYVFLSGPGVDASGKPDNDPYRAAAFLLILSPVFILTLSMYFYAVAAVLDRIGHLTLFTMLAPNVLVSISLGAVFYRQGLDVGGVPDALISFVTFGGFTLLCLCAGTAFWHWSQARTPYNKAMKTDVE